MKITLTFVVPHAETWLGSGRVNKMGANDGDGGKIDIDGRKSDLQKRTPLFMAAAESIRLPGLPYDTSIEISCLTNGNVACQNY